MNMELIEAYNRLEIKIQKLQDQIRCYEIEIKELTEQQKELRYKMPTIYYIWSFGVHPDMPLGIYYARRNSLGNEWLKKHFPHMFMIDAIYFRDSYYSHLGNIGAKFHAKPVDKNWQEVSRIADIFEKW